MADDPKDPQLPDVEQPDLQAAHPNIRPFTLHKGDKKEPEPTAPLPGTAPTAATVPAKQVPPAELIRKMTKQERCEWIYDLRLDGNLSWHKLAKAFECSVSSVQRMWKKRREQIADDDIETRRHMANGILEGIVAGLMPRAMHGDSKAAEAIIKALERQSRMYGDDSPVKVASTSPDGKNWAPLMVEQLRKNFTLDELKALHKAEMLRLSAAGALEGEVVNGKT